MQILQIFMILFFLWPVTAHSLADVGLDLIGGMETGGSYDIDLAEKFRSEKPQDLYLLLYKKMKYDPADVTIKKSLDSRKLTAGEKDALKQHQNLYAQILTIGLVGGQEEDISSLYIGEETVLTPEAFRERDVALRLKLDEELEIAKLESEIEAEVKPTEIFTNGTTEDSGFDLLQDLDIIEAILFAKQLTQYSGFGPANPPGAAQIDVSGAGGAGAGAGGAGGGPGAGVGEPPAPPRSGAEAGNGPAGAISQSLEAAIESNGAVCHADSGLNAAADAAGLTQAVQELKNEKVLAGATGSTQQALNSGGPPSPRRAGLRRAGGNAESEGGTEPEPPLAPAQPFNFSRPQQCDGTFCVTVEAKMKKESAYTVTDNCVACHVEKINDLFKKVTSHNLSPNKVTGNLMEIPKCKGSISFPSFFNLNVITLGQPILTPPNDDIVVASDFLQEFGKMWESAYPDSSLGIGGTEKTAHTVTQSEANSETTLEDIAGLYDKKAEELEQLNGIKRDKPLGFGQTIILIDDVDPQEIAAQRSRSQSYETTTSEDSIRKIGNEVSYKEKAVYEEIRKQRDRVMAENLRTNFSVLKVEIDTMNAYFRSYQNLFKKMQSPCDALNAKEVCK